MSLLVVHEDVWFKIRSCKTIMLVGYIILHNSKDYYYIKNRETGIIKEKRSVKGLQSEVNRIMESI